MQYVEMDLRNKTTPEFRTVFLSPLGVPNSQVSLYIAFHAFSHPRRIFMWRVCAMRTVMEWRNANLKVNLFFMWTIRSGTTQDLFGIERIMMDWEKSSSLQPWCGCLLLPWKMSRCLNSPFKLYNPRFLWSLNFTFYRIIFVHINAWCDIRSTKFYGQPKMVIMNGIFSWFSCLCHQISIERPSAEKFRAFMFLVTYFIWSLV